VISGSDGTVNEVYGEYPVFCPLHS